VDFLTTNRTVIVNSLPHLVDHKGLDGAWTKRFILSIKGLSSDLVGDMERKKFSDPSDGVRQLLDRYYLRLEHQKFSGPTIANRPMNLERTKSDLDSFWQEVIIERLQRKVQSTYDKETLLTFDESGKHYGEQLRIPYKKEEGKEEETSSGCKRSNSTLDSDSTSPVETKKIRPGKDVNVEEANNDDVVKMTSIAYQQFTDKYRKLKKKINGLCQLKKFLCHSFLIDPDDKNYIQQGIFTPEELKEIQNFSKKKLPSMPDDLLKYLNSFRKSNTSDLRELIFRSDLHDQLFDRSKNFDYDWIRNTTYNLVLEYEANHLAKDHLETWIMLHVWSFIDKIFLDIDGMEIVRGESCSYASSNRKNSQRVVASTGSMKKKAMGRRGDLIIRKWHTEYGCGEAGKIFEGINGTKIIKEGGLKMPKMLRDMFNDLCETMKMRKDKIRKLETVGFIISGLKISLLRLDLPAGHVCRLSRTRLFEIPTQVSEFGAKVLPTMSLIWKAKAIVKNVIKLMEEEDLTEEEQLKMLQNCDEVDESGLTTPPPRLQLLSSSVTPENKRKSRNDEK
ncbi:6334_t:CDS:10, partial [Ambispora gerdemannii]